MLYWTYFPPYVGTPLASPSEYSFSLSIFSDDSLRIKSREKKKVFSAFYSPTGLWMKLNMREQREPKAKLKKERPFKVVMERNLCCGGCRSEGPFGGNWNFILLLLFLFLFYFWFGFETLKFKQRKDSLVSWRSDYKDHDDLIPSHSKWVTWSRSCGHWSTTQINFSGSQHSYILKRKIVFIPINLSLTT